MNENCDVKTCDRSVFKTVKNKKLTSPISFCEAHYYAGQLIGAALRQEGGEKYQELLDKMAKANDKVQSTVRVEQT